MVKIRLINTVYEREWGNNVPERSMQLRQDEKKHGLGFNSLH